MIVVDASCLVEVLLRTAHAAAIETRLRCAGGLHAPELLDLEVLWVLRRRPGERYRRSGATSPLWPASGRRSVAGRTPWCSGASGPLRTNVTAYDAAYVALAERLRCPVRLPRDGARGDMQDGRSVLTMPFRGENTDADGAGHEGALAALLDTTGAMASWSLVGIDLR